MGRKRKNAGDGERPQLKLVKGTGGKGRGRTKPSEPEGELEMEAMAEQFTQMHQELLDGVAKGIKKVSRGRKKEEVVVEVYDPYCAAAFEALVERLGLEASRKKRAGKYSFTVIIAPQAAEEIFLPFWKMMRGMLEQQLGEAADTFITMAVHGEMPEAPDEDEWELDRLVEELEDLEDDDDLPF
jgi:hypothetical protein